MKILIMASIMIVLATSNSFATAQYPDKIIYENKEYMLHSNPMESYFETHQDKRPKDGIRSSALWRGYVATFEVKGITLFLKDIEIQFSIEKKDGTRVYKWKSVKDSIVLTGEALQIDWFTGILVLPGGKIVNYVHMGYGSTYSNYILLEIKSGKLTGVRKLDAKGYEVFKEKQFQSFKKTEEYKKHALKHALELKKEGDSQDSIDSFLRDFIINYTSKFLDDEGTPNKAEEHDTAR